jgi:toxin ParE1/3/4
MSHEVLLPPSVVRDIEQIVEQVCRSQSTRRAREVLDQLMAVRDSLAHFPQRGSPPRELLALGLGGYRQIVSPPYRIIYYLSDDRVIVLLIADGRRDMRSLLEQRLLGA